MSEFIGPEANYWDNKVDKHRELSMVERNRGIGKIVLWRVLQDINMINRHLIENDPNYNANRDIYNQIVTGGENGIPE